MAPSVKDSEGHDYSQQTTRCDFNDPLPLPSDGRRWEAAGFDIVAPRSYSSAFTTHVAWITVDAPPLKEGHP